MNRNDSVELYGVRGQNAVATPLFLLTPGAVAVTIAYPASPGAHFDWDYYLNKHVPLVSKLLGPAVREASIVKGLAGASKDAPAPFVAIATMRFDSVDAFQAAAAPHTAEIMADIAKFTDIKPVIQVSSIEVDR